MDLSPILYRVQRVLRGGRSFHYKDVAEKSWQICPPIDPATPLPPAIALEDQFERVTGLSHSGKTFSRERALLSGEWKEPRTTTAYQLNNISLLHGYIYKGPMKHTVVSDPERWVGWGQPRYIPKAAMGCTHTGNTWYSHWMTDNLTLELAAERLAEPVITQHKPYSHAGDYRRYLELSAPKVEHVCCDQLIVVDDVSQNAYKRERYQQLRSQLRKVGQHKSGHGVMIRRGRSGQLRLLVNEPEVEQFLAKQGFTIVDPQQMSVTDIVRQIQGAKIVVGVEGSTMAHGFFSLADGGTLCILQPPYRFNALYKEYADCVGMRFAYVVGRPAPDGFTIDLNELGKTLDLIDQVQLA